MKQSVKKNYIYNLIYQILAIFLPIITTPYIARTLGAEGNGIYSYTISIVTYFILFGTLGTNLYGQREIAYVQNDKEKRSKVFFEILILRLISMSISMILFYFIFARSGEYSIYYKILLLEMLANCLDITWFFQGLEDFKKIVIRNLIIKIISILSIFIFVKDNNDIDTYILIHCLSILFGNLIIWLETRKYIIKPNKINIAKHIKPMLTLFIPQVAIQVYVVLDKTMIGAITNSMDEVGYYEQAQKIIRILLTVITSLSTVMMPRIAKNFADKDFDKIKYYMNQTFKFIYMLSLPLTFGIIAVSNNFVPLFFGEGYDKVPLIMIILSFIVIFISISGAIGNQFLLSTKRQKQYTISVIAGAVTNFILNLILIYYFKSYGAAIATLIAEFTVMLIQFIFVRKDIDIKENLLSAKNYLISSIIMFISCIIIDKLISDNLTCIFIQVMAGMIIYFAILLILKDRFLIELLEQLLSKLKIKKKKDGVEDEKKHKQMGICIK